MPTIVIDGCPEGIHYKLHTARQSDTAPPLVLVHGAGGNLMHWPGELRRLPGRTVLALDLPGHGHSGGSARPPGGDVSHDINEYAQVIAQVLEKLSLPRFVIAGHSMGGAIAQEMALRRPEMLAGLVLVATGARLPVDPEVLSAIQGDWQSVVRVLAGWSQGAHVDPKSTQIYLRRLSELDPQMVYRDYAACNLWDRSAELGRISAPTLVICGDADRMMPLEYSLDLKRKIRGARLLIVPGAGHMVMLEQPDLVAGAIQQLLADLTPL
jgi:pimeloyl-ACP methyl ester carboxylesterase